MHGRAAHGGLPTANQSTKFPTLVRSLVLSSTNFRRHPCSASKSVPPVSGLLEIFRATDSTASSVMLTGMKIGVSSYVFNVAQEGFVCDWMFSFQNRCSESLILLKLHQKYFYQDNVRHQRVFLKLTISTRSQEMLLF